MAVEKASLLNSKKTLLVNDSDLWKYEIFLTWWKSWVLFSDPVLKEEFELTGTTNPSISSWSAVIICNRATSTPIANQKIAVKFDMEWPKVFSSAVNWSKIYIEINQTLINDPTLIEDNYPSTDFALWLNIGSMNMSTSYPVSNSYIPLYTYNWTIWTDVRTAPTVDWKNVDLTDLVGDIITTGDIEATDIVANWNVSTSEPTSPEHSATKQYVDDIILWFSNSKLTQEFDSGENMAIWKFITSWTPSLITQNTQNAQQRFWYNSIDYEIWQSYLANETWYLYSIGVWLFRNVTPNQVRNLEVFSDTGTTLLSTSINSIDISTFASATLCNFIFDKTLLVTNWNTYYFKLNYVSWSISTTSYTFWQLSTSNPYAWWQSYVINNSNVWTAVSWSDLRFEVWIKKDKLNKQ